MKKKIAILIGTGLGTGFSPWAPGTMGAIFATAVWAAIGFTTSSSLLVLVTTALILVFTLLGTWATAVIEPLWGDDPRRVVVDEMVGVWIPLLVVNTPQTEWHWAFAALILFRLFDILKPFGIRTLDRRRGAFWVMADDILAGIYALLCLMILRLLFS